MTQSDIVRQLVEIVRKYLPSGVLIGQSEFLLPPDAALNLVDDLESIGIAIWGVDCWFYGDPLNKKKITENVGFDLTVPDEVMLSEDAVRRSAALVKDFIQHRLPAHTALVSLVLEDAYLGINLNPNTLSQDSMGDQFQTIDSP